MDVNRGRYTTMTGGFYTCGICKTDLTFSDVYKSYGGIICHKCHAEGRDKE